MKHYFVNTFSSLSVRNFRLYFIGQAISASGTFMQAVAQAWLILKLTNSGTALGLVTALQFVPMLLFGPWGGVVADRFDKRKVLVVTQTIFGIQALLLGILVVSGVVQVWMVGTLAFIYGVINVIDNPVRQTFVPEMVGDDKLRNAVSLYTSLVNLARVLGPLFGAFLIATVGIGMCFIVNGVSYVAIILLLIAMSGQELHKAERVNKVKGQMQEGLRYIFRTPVLLYTLGMMAIMGTFTYEYQVSLPLLAQFTFHGDAGTFAVLMSAQGVGAIIGGILFAGQKNSSVRLLVAFALLFGLSTALSAVMPSLLLTVVAIFIVGFFSVLFLSLGNTILQLESEPKMRGRVMAYWSMAFLGSTAIGGPIIGWIGQNMSPRWGLGLGGLAAIIASGIGYIAIADMRRRAPEAIVERAQLTADEENRLR